MHICSKKCYSNRYDFSCHFINDWHNNSTIACFVYVLFAFELNIDRNYVYSFQIIVIYKNCLISWISFYLWVKMQFIRNVCWQCLSFHFLSFFIYFSSHLLLEIIKFLSKWYYTFIHCQFFRLFFWKRTPWFCFFRRQETIYFIEMLK